MADPIKIYQVCGKCHGDGQFPNAYIDFYGNVVEPEETVDCPRCGGDGIIEGLLIDGDLRSFLEDIVSKVDDIEGVVEEIKDIVEAL